MNNITVYLFGKDLKDKYSSEGVSRVIEKVKTLLNSSEAKLLNQSFLEKAPSNVIGKERNKINYLKETLDTLQRIVKDFEK